MYLKQQQKYNKIITNSFHNNSGKSDIRFAVIRYAEKIEYLASVKADCVLYGNT